jgi:hypothetical protein
VQVKTIAMMPGGGLLADAIAIELGNKGLKVIDPTSTSSLMVRLNLNEVEISRPEGLAKLRSQGIDAILVVRAAAGADQMPESATARLSSTADGQLLVGASWQNGGGNFTGTQYGGFERFLTRKGLSGAAAQIANELASRMQS